MTSILCPVCAADSCSPLETLGRYHLHRCQNCDLQFWDPIRNPGHRWYEEAARYVLRDKVRNRPSLHWRHRQFLRRALPQCSCILDIGCGVGAFVAHCEAKGYEAIGIDIDRNAIATAREVSGLRQVYPLSLEEFIQRSETQGFDAITFFEVLEHLDEPARFISTIKRLLKSAGCIALSVPNRDRWHLLPLEDVPPNHLTRWNVAALRRFLDSQGFEVLEISENPLSLQLAMSVVSGKLNDWVPGLRHLKRKFLHRTAKLVASPEESRARIARRGYRLLVALWTAALYAPAVFVVAYARLGGKKGDCIYCLAQSRDGNRPTS
jgi:2-polyprenyl-3-methyl-5-hydroxy-6-metoxy-1,4-benzoquinol methylase